MGMTFSDRGSGEQPVLLDISRRRPLRNFQFHDSEFQHASTSSVRIPTNLNERCNDNDSNSEVN